MKRLLIAVLLSAGLSACGNDTTNLDLAADDVRTANNAAQIAVGMCDGEKPRVCVQVASALTKLNDAQTHLAQAKRDADDDFPWYAVIIFWLIVFVVL